MCCFQVDDVFGAGFSKLHGDPILGRCGDVFADEVGFDGQFAVSAIDQDRELNAAGASEIVERIEGRASGAATTENIIDQHHGFAVEIEGDVSRVNFGCGLFMEVITMEGDIDGSQGHGVSTDVLQELMEPGGEMDAASLDADERDLLAVLVLFHDLVSDSGKNALDRAAVQDDVAIGHKKNRIDPGWTHSIQAEGRFLSCASLATSQDRIKGGALRVEVNVS